MEKQIPEVAVGQSTQNLTLKFETSNPLRSLAIGVGTAVTAVAFTKVVYAVVKKI